MFSSLILLIVKVMTRIPPLSPPPLEVTPNRTLRRALTKTPTLKWVFFDTFKKCTIVRY